VESRGLICYVYDVLVERGKWKVESEKKNVERSGIPQGGTESWKQKE
jgi:hypothetical protein